jgi:UDP-2,3-diacylglucosamine hydrolase
MSTLLNPDDNPNAKSGTTPTMRLGLIAGEGSLPLHVARNACKRGITVVPFLISRETGPLRELCGQAGHRIAPGLVRQTMDLLVEEQITHLVFAGKVNKWILLRNPRLDDLAADAIKTMARLNDDAVMLWLVDQLEQRGIQVLPQSDFLENLFLPEQILTTRMPNEEEWRDARYGFEIAREIGRLDIGQSIVARAGMILAVEAIEGTDECLRRAGKLAARKGGVVVKVAKPGQDQRFDIPTVGLRTLKTMQRVGLHMLATEADRTLYLEAPEMIAYANRHKMILVSMRHDSPDLNGVTTAADAQGCTHGR